MKNSATMSSDSSSTVTIFQCNAPLEVIHAHLVRAQHADEPGDWFLAYPEWVSPLGVRADMWREAISVQDSRPEYGAIASRIRTNLARLQSRIPFERYSRIDLVVSDLFWLMNNVLAGEVARLCEQRGIDFGLSILDEGSVLYTGSRLGVRRTLRCWAKFAYLKLHGFAGFWLHPKNVDYLHPLCKRVFCLHPKLLSPPSRILIEEIDPRLLERVYGERLVSVSLPPKSCLYLFQPLYKLVGVQRQLQIVHGFLGYLRQRGIRHFYYKPHHADLPHWCGLLEGECGLKPLELREMVPIEFLSARCNADVILSHSTSALLNLHAYGFRGEVIAYGLDKLRQSFPEASQFEDYTRALKALGGIELVAAE